MGRYCTYTHGSNNKGCCQSPEFLCQFTVSVLFCFEYEMTDNIQKLNNPKSYTACKDLLEQTYITGHRIWHLLRHWLQNFTLALKEITSLQTGSCSKASWHASERFFVWVSAGTPTSVTGFSWEFCSFGIWSHISGWSDPNVSKKHSFIFVAWSLKMTLGCLEMLGPI